MLKSGSPLIQGIIDEALEKGRRDRIVAVLAARFGPEARTLRKDLKAVGDPALEELVTIAATCPDLDSFREQVAPRRRRRRS